MNGRKKKTLVLNTLTLILCVIVIGLFSYTPEPKEQIAFEDPLEIYKVVFDTGGGNYIDAMEIEEGSSVTAPENPTREGYEFIGWMLGDELYDFSQGLSGDITLKAAWKELDPTVTYYTVYFDTTGGSIVANQIVEEGSLASRPNDPTRSGYIFVGWTYSGEDYDFTLPVTGDMTIIAEWEKEPEVDPTERTYTVTFRLNGGSGSIATQNIKYGETARKPNDPTRSGYTFNGWRLNSASGTAYNFSSPVTSNITLYASWTEIPKQKFKVTFVYDDGSSRDVSVTEGSLATLPKDPTKAYHTFQGWFTVNGASGGQNAKTFRITADTKFYARFTKQTFKISCTPTDSSGASQTCSFTVRDANNNVVPNSQITALTYNALGNNVNAVSMGTLSNGSYWAYTTIYSQASNFKVTVGGVTFDANK